MKLKCYFEYDEANETVTITSAKHGNTIMKLKIESSATGTIERIDAECENDNFWLAIKPADSVVFDEMLFARSSKLKINELKFEL